MATFILSANLRVGGIVTVVNTDDDADDAHGHPHTRTNRTDAFEQCPTSDTTVLTQRQLHTIHGFTH